MITAQIYSLNNGLSLQDGMPATLPGSLGGSPDKGISNSIISGSRITGPVETNREATKKKVKALEELLNTARAADTTPIHIAPQLEANVNLYKQLQLLKTQLQEKSTLFRDNDPSIQTLKRKIRGLTQLVNQQTVNLIEGQLETANAQLISLTRPREVLLKQRELVRAALIDEAMLVQLEAQLQNLQIEKARQTDPWELITTPTLMDKPVWPKKTLIIGLGLLGGIVLGCGTALLVDRRTGRVYTEDELDSFLPCPLVEHLPSMNQEAWSDAADLLAAGPLTKVSGNGAIGLIPIGNMPSEQVQAFSTELRRALQGRELLVSTDLRETRMCSNQLLITSPGVATRTQLSQFRQKLALQGAPLAGWVLLDPDLTLG